MGDKLLELRSKIKGNFLLNPKGDTIYSNLCVIYPKDVRVINKLGLTIDTWDSGLCPRLRFCFRNI